MQITTAQRSAQVGNARIWIVENAHEWYEELRPLALYTTVQFEARCRVGETSYYDCSWWMTQLAYATGLLDPSGPTFNFNGYGDTQDEYDFLPHITSWEYDAEPDFSHTLLGDIVMFDPPPESLAHATIYMGDGMVGSMGGSPGQPREISYADERLGHPGQVTTVLSIANLSKTAPPPPPPLDPHHYNWFDGARIRLPHGINSERNVVKNYDLQRQHPVKNKASLALIHSNLVFLHTRVLNNEKATHDLRGEHYHRAWRALQLEMRVKGQQVVK